MSPKKNCRLIGYTRVSTDRQGRSGLGLDAQQAAIAAYVQSSGCSLIKTYTEVESGRNNERTELAAAIQHAKRAKATLVIAKLDRLSRNVAFLSNLMESKVTFVACDYPEADKFIIHVLVALAEKEAEMISRRTKDALAQAKARGVVLGAPHHLTNEARLKGSRKGVKTIKKNRAEAYAHIIPTIKALRAKGMSLQAIADELNAMGEETRGGKPWNPMQVSRVLG